MATRGTLGSQEFKALVAALPPAQSLVLQACDGLADAIERNDAIKTEALCAQYTRAIGQFGLENGGVDTLVLGCTHYPFAQEVLRHFTGPDVVFCEGGVPVARQTRKLLDAAGLLTRQIAPGNTHFLTTGAVAPLTAAIARWLSMHVQVAQLSPHQGV
jgi:glutamate racemase